MNLRKMGNIANDKIIRILFIFLIIGLVCWLFIPKISDFGLNFFTEILGVSITPC